MGETVLLVARRGKVKTGGAGGQVFSLKSFLQILVDGVGGRL